MDTVTLIPGLPVVSVAGREIVVSETVYADLRMIARHYSFQSFALSDGVFMARVDGQWRTLHHTVSYIRAYCRHGHVVYASLDERNTGTQCLDCGLLDV